MGYRTKSMRDVGYTLVEMEAGMGVSAARKRLQLKGHTNSVKSVCALELAYDTSCRRICSFMVGSDWVKSGRGAS